MKISPGQGVMRDVEGAQSPSTVDLVLPAPPSVNEAFRNVPGKGRVKTKVYDAWHSHASWRIRLQKPGTIIGNVMLLIGVERISERADIDNRIKLILDVLVSQKVITDDRYVTAFAACWQPSANKIARVSILPVQALTLAFHPSPDGASGGWFLAPPQET